MGGWPGKGLFALCAKRAAEGVAACFLVLLPFASKPTFARSSGLA